MELFRIRSLSVGYLQVNCYMLINAAGNGYIIDPGAHADAVIQAVRDEQMQPVCILLTHGHVDHISAVGAVAAAFAVPVYLHPDETALYRSPANALLPLLPAATDLPEPVSKIPPVSGLPLDVIHTPGHTRGGVCFHFPEQRVLFSGDTLFRHSVGRTDLTGGNAAALIDSIHEKLLRLKGQTTVYPGHGPATTIEEEKRENPYL